MKSIQSKFLTIVISSILILAVIITLVSFLFMKRTLNNDSDIITESVADTEALRINDYLKDVEHAVMTMENYIRLTLIGKTDILKDTYERQEYEEAATDAFYAPMQNVEGIVAFYLIFSPEFIESDVPAGFYAGKASSAAKEFSPKEPNILDGWTTGIWYTQPKANGVPLWLLPYTCENTDQEIVSYAIPIYIDNQFIGVAGVDVEFDKIVSMVERISVYDNGFAYLADASKTPLHSVDHELLERAEHHDHGFAEEKKTLDNGMMLIIHADYSDIQRNNYRMTVIIVCIVTVFLASFIVITYILTKKIVRPLRELTSAAEVLADGRTDLQLEGCKTHDEVGVLAKTFEKMAEKLGGYMNYINALAYKDSLTGVKNRTAYNEAATELDLAIELGDCKPFAILIADINGLKKTNDRYGHEIGNRHIIKAAKIICDVFKHSPVYRIGGDEFVVLLKGDDFEARDALLAKLDESYKDASIMSGEETIKVSVARAIEVYESGRDYSFDDVFNRADKKMYEHKKNVKKITE